MVLSLNKAYMVVPIVISYLGSCLLFFLFLHPANLEHFSIVEEKTQKITFPKLDYHANVAAAPKPASGTLRWL